MPVKSFVLSAPAHVHDSCGAAIHHSLPPPPTFCLVEDPIGSISDPQCSLIRLKKVIHQLNEVNDAADRAVQLGSVFATS